MTGREKTELANSNVLSLHDCDQDIRDTKVIAYVGVKDMVELSVMHVDGDDFVEVGVIDDFFRYVPARRVLHGIAKNTSRLVLVSALAVWLQPLH